MLRPPKIVSVPLPIMKVHIPALKLSHEFIPATPQGHLQLAVNLLATGNGASASNQLWLCASQQLKILLQSYHLDVRDYRMKDAVVEYYLAKKCTSNSGKFVDNWDLAYLGHLNSYEDFQRSSQRIYEWIEKTVMFCNELYDIHAEKRFDKKELIKALKKENLAYKANFIIF